MSNDRRGPLRMVVVVATKNEVRNVPLVIAELARAAAMLATGDVTVEAVVVDDASTDGTRQTLFDEASLRGLSLRVIDGPNSGLSGAVVTGLHAALDAAADVICLLDADGQHDALEIPTLVESWRANPDVDAVFGSRFLPDSSFQGVTRSRKVLSHGSRLALRGATRMTIPSDPTTSFRVSSPEVVRRFLNEVPVARLDGYQFFFWFAVFTAAHFRFADVPIRFRPRLTGSSHLRMVDVVRAAKSLPEIGHRSREWRRRGVHHEPFPVYPTDYLDAIAEMPTYVQWIADVVSPHLVGAVAEIGAGTGTMTSLFAAAPYVTELVAIEPDAARAGRLAEAVNGTPHISVVQGTVATLGRHVDTMVYCNSLEHIKDLAGELAAARDRLDDDGRLVVFGPGHEALYGDVDHASGHWRRFALRHLGNDITAAGFRVERAEYLDPLGAVGYLAGSLTGGADLSPTMLKIYERIILPPSKALGRLTAKSFGKNVLIVARKRSA